MRRRLLEICLLAYPRELRERDRDHLRDLALDLAASNGTAREALGLIRGGLVARRRHGGRARRAVIAVGAVTGLGLALLTWSAAAQGGRVEEDRFTCAGACAEVEAEVASRVRDGWSCSERREPTAVTWRCSTD
jgi:uncharacterized protein YcfJ